jgi:hypothetical protein
MNFIKNVVFLLKIFDDFIEIPMIKFKEVIVNCYKDDMFSHYGEVFQNITKKQLTKLVGAGFNGFNIIADGKEIALSLKRKRKKRK